VTTRSQWRCGEEVVATRRRGEAKCDRSRDSKEAWKTEDFRQEHKWCGGIFIVLKNINSGSSLEPLPITFISSGYSFKLMLTRILSAAGVVFMNHCW
jgi:hypothetical protein